VIDAADLRPGDPFKCAKCKKLMNFGPHLWDPQTAQQWQMLRMITILACVAVTTWCLMTGYEMGRETGNWAVGFGGPLLVWFIAVGCLALAAMTSQNNGVPIGVVAVMSAMMLVFVQRLAGVVGYDLSGWRRYRLHSLWVPLLLVGGAAVLVVTLVRQVRRRSL
jgi:hypothetical protein